MSRCLTVVGERIIHVKSDTVIDHHTAVCPDCGLAPSADLSAEAVSAHEEIELPEVKPLVEQHRRLGVAGPACRAQMACRSGGERR